MSLGPILPGRLPNSLASRRLNHQIQTGQQLIQRLQDQLTTGQKYQAVGEDPVSAMSTIILQKTIERNEQFATNIQTDRSLLDATENALGSVADVFNRARTILHEGLSSLGPHDREALATEIGGLLTQTLNAGNSKFRGRYLFAGTQGETAPFELTGSGQVLYRGNGKDLESYVGHDQLFTTNVDGNTAFNALTTVDGTDLDAALTLDTRLSDLRDGLGIDQGSLKISVTDGGSTETRIIDLSFAETVADVKVLIEDAFVGTAVPVTVAVDPATRNGIQLTPDSGTVSVANVSGERTASQLGIVSGLASQIDGGDLDPRLTLQTLVSDLNGGAGIGSTAGTGLLIENGSKSAVVDLDSASTIEDLLNELRLADLDLDVGLNDSQNGLSVSSRLAGAEFSIGENGGSNATNLGIRTFSADTLLADLNHGIGIQIPDGQQLEITRRDGSVASVDLSSAFTVQDVLDAINSVDAGNLTAGLSELGNGISLLDNSGTGPLIVEGNQIATSLGIAGEENGTDPSVALTGRDVDTRKNEGLVGLLTSLQQALLSDDQGELNRLSASLDTEADRFLNVRGDVATRLKTLESIENRVLDDRVKLQEDLTAEFEVDLAAVLSAFLTEQQTLEATYRIAGQSLQLNLLSFL